MSLLALSEMLNSDALYAFPVYVALIGSAYSVFTDLRSGKIKNYVTFPMILVGWAWGFSKGFESGVINMLWSCLVAISATRVGILGAGDVKLIVGIAACLGMPTNLIFLAAFFIVSAVSSIVFRIVVHRINLISAFKAIMKEIKFELSGLGLEAGEIAHGRSMKMAGGPVIFVALVVTLLRPLIIGGLM